MNPGARALALTLSLAAPALFSGCGPSQAQGGPPMAPPVSAAPAVSKNIPLYDEFSGRLEGQARRRIRLLDTDCEDLTADRTACPPADLRAFG